MCPQESASAWARPWPAWNYSSTSPPSFKTSPYALWYHLLTSTSRPRSQALATSLRPTSSASWSAERPLLDVEGTVGEQSSARVQTYPTSSSPFNSHNNPKRRHYYTVTGHWSAGVIPKYGAVYLLHPAEKQCPGQDFGKSLRILSSFVHHHLGFYLYQILIVDLHVVMLFR